MPLSLSTTVKATIRQIFSAAGWMLHSVPENRQGALDVRDSADHPAALLYYGQQTVPSVLIDAPVERGYSLEAFTLDADGANPYIRAIRHAETSNKSRQAIRQTLAQYYRAVQPASAAQWLGVEGDRIPALADQPPWARVFPWENDTIDQRRYNVQGKTRQENRRQGTELTIENGWKLCGPVDQAFLDMKTDRLHSLYQSIKTHGYIRNDEIGGDIRTIVLVDDDDRWRWLQCGGGFHRAAVCSALGYQTLPVRVWRVIFRRDVDIWPGVANGLYSRTAALEVFDRIVAGKPTPIARQWCQT